MIDTSTWKEFCVGKLFSCETTLGIPSKNDLEDGNINYITRSAADNGFSGTCGNEDHRNEGNCITIGAEGFVAFWQSDDFVAGNKVYALRHPEMNETNGLFVCASLNALSDRYSFADARVLDKIKVEVIKLPATSDGQPDWAYMESYMKQIMEESEKSLENLKKADDTKHPIDVSGWGAFRVGDLFKKLNTGFLGTGKKKDSISKEPTEEFCVPLSYAKRYNNGIMYWGRKGEWKTHKNALTVVYNGAVSAGRVYAQSDETGVLAESYMIKLKNVDVSFFTYLFLQRIMEDCIYHKYSYSDLAVWDSVKENNIYLPITIAGEPDWQYMEDYMKSIMDQSEKVIECLNTYRKGKE